MAFNPKTGALIGPIPGQGLTGDSTWARGQAWALNGFTRAYELTGNAELLDASQRTAAFWVSKVPPGCIPAWDFDIDNSRAPRDSSAASIAADGLLSLRRVVGDTAADYGAYADVTLGLLATPWMTTARSVNPGILLQQTLNVPSDPREGSYVWGDYYLLRALSAA
jgi:unsaturated chondroitin disaccharide hydrolase